MKIIAFLVEKFVIERIIFFTSDTKTLDAEFG